ncbi:inactive leucine-rich repeat receptor-like serine/threonine-protein kinase At1g60630 [Impatiens glandulifera]|uniref:inactive leucine-rich repeat receptor-like serine/threonine-protein kinase At1g60630 n=1 Tax=Impatiens glandulifera TaxID=253017 RepID=UPI001FB15790|nr:inactive leucine-rich repeat receptor-like serine/threonine-protein kinase At1g60630 [Impatiens glandulifera]
MIRYMEFPRRTSCILLLLFSTSFSFLLHCALSDDADTLLSLKSEIDNSNHLQWRHGSDPCQWKGVKQCLKGRVIKLVLEHLNLTGQLNINILNKLDQLRLLSFKANSLTGQIPDLSSLPNLKSIYLNGNHFSGQIPATLSLLHRLKVIVISDNRISGEIPNSLLNLSRLYVLSLDNNQLTGEIPPFNQPSLRFFNVSNNHLHGQIPVTPAMVRFSISSFFGNIGLCGTQIESTCDLMSPSASPSSPIKEKKKKHGLNRKQITAVVVGSVGGFGLLILCLIIMCVVCKRSGRTSSRTVTTTAEGNNNGGAVGAGGGKQFSWEETEEGGGTGNLVFLVGEGVGEERMNYTMEDLLKASAETLGRGTVGSTYKAVMESGYIVTVKRLREARYPRVEEFRRYMEILGRLRHPNLVPIRAYFHAKEERLLVYDYFPNGSLFSLIHGSRAPPGGGKPLHWTSCLKIAEDVAAGLLYIHQNSNLTHGNLKSSNVLLGSDFESCLTDYGLSSFKNPDDITVESSGGGVFYKAPECRHMTTTATTSTQEGDVYSFGVLVLELLTGKTPFEDVVEEHGSDIPKWVRSVREDHETEESDDGPPNEDKLGALLNIAMACVSVCGDERPVIKEVLRMVREARAEAHVSSNSSDHSPGRWSDTVQSLPREDHQHLSI